MSSGSQADKNPASADRMLSAIVITKNEAANLPD